MRGHWTTSRDRRATVKFPSSIAWNGRGTTVETPESKERIHEIDVARRGFIMLGEYVGGLRQTLTPARPEWRGKSDARRMAISNLYEPCLTNPTVMFNLLFNLGQEPGLLTFAKLTGLDGENIKNREKVFWDITNSVLTNTILVSQFQVEVLFQNLWRELGGAEERSFVRLSERLLSKLGYDTGSIKEKMDRLRALSYLRNSLHNNGIHKGPDHKLGLKATLQNLQLTVQIEATLVFERDKVVNVAGPTYVFVLLQAVVDVVREVISHPTIAAIQGPIRDDFAWSIENEEVKRKTQAASREA